MRFDLPSDKIPTAWFNALAHLPEPMDPPLHPGTREPVGPDDLSPLFPMALIEQEMSPAPWVDVPGEVIDILKLWRPTPLVRAERLDPAALDAKGQIRHDGGVLPMPGAYVLGLPFLRRRKSSFLDGVGGDAQELASHLTGHLDRVSRVA